MSKKQPQIGRKLKYKYDSKWYKSEITEIKNNKITITIWKSILKPKIISIDRCEWKQIISSNPKMNTILRFDDNRIYPDWIRISQIVIINDRHFTSKSTPQIAKIIHYKNGSFIIIQYIRYNNYQNPYNTKAKQLITKTIYKHQILFTQKFICFSEKILYPYYNPFENGNYSDIIFELNNRKLIKRLHKINNNNNLKSTAIKMNMIKKENDEYICNSKLQYGLILNCKAFPYDINKLLMSFLAQKMIYICPPTLCCKLKTVPGSWQFNGSLSVIGCKFTMNKDLIINGFELNHIEMLGLHKHEIVLCQETKVKLTAEQVQLKEHRTDAQYMFRNDECVTLKRNGEYIIKIKVNANVPCYQWHESPLNMYCYMNNIGLKHSKKQDGDMVIENWKCFKRISWMKFIGYNRYGSNCTDKHLSWFPHFALLLP